MLASIWVTVNFDGTRFDKVQGCQSEIFSIIFRLSEAAHRKLPTLRKGNKVSITKTCAIDTGVRLIHGKNRGRLAGAVCAVVFDHDTETLQAGADPRRESYAIGW